MCVQVDTYPVLQLLAGVNLHTRAMQGIRGLAMPNRPAHLFYMEPGASFAWGMGQVWSARLLHRATQETYTVYVTIRTASITSLTAHADGAKGM